MLRADAVRLLLDARRAGLHPAQPAAAARLAARRGRRSARRAGPRRCASATPPIPTAQMGPLISAAQRDRVEGIVDGAVSDGAKLVAGGGRPAGLDDGFYFEPTILTDVDPDSSIAQEEVFGPVLDGAALPRRRRRGSDRQQLAATGCPARCGARDVDRARRRRPPHPHRPGRGQRHRVPATRRSAASSRAGSAARAA